MKDHPQVDALARELEESRAEIRALRARVVYLEEVLDAWQEAGSEAMTRMDPLSENHPVSRLLARVAGATARAHVESLVEFREALSPSVQDHER